MTRDSVISSETPWKHRVRRPGTMGPWTMGPWTMGPRTMGPGTMGPATMGPGIMGLGTTPRPLGAPLTRDSQVVSLEIPQVVSLVIPRFL